MNNVIDFTDFVTKSARSPNVKDRAEAAMLRIFMDAYAGATSKTVTPPPPHGAKKPSGDTDPANATIAANLFFNQEEELRRAVGYVNKSGNVPTTLEDLTKAGAIAPSNPGGPDKLKSFMKILSGNLNVEIQKWQKYSSLVSSGQPIPRDLEKYRTFPPFNSLPPEYRNLLLDKRALAESIEQSSTSAIKNDPNRGLRDIVNNIEAGAPAKQIKPDINNVSFDLNEEIQRSSQKTGFSSPLSDSTDILVEGDEATRSAIRSRLKPNSSGQYNYQNLVGLKVGDPKKEVNLGFDRPVLLKIENGIITGVHVINGADPANRDRSLQFINNAKSSGATLSYGRAFDQVATDRTLAQMQAHVVNRIQWARHKSYNKEPGVAGSARNRDMENQLFSDVIGKLVSSPSVNGDYDVKVSSSLNTTSGTSATPDYIRNIFQKGGVKDKILYGILGCNMNGASAGQINQLLLQNPITRELAKKAIRSNISFDSVFNNPAVNITTDPHLTSIPVATDTDKEKVLKTINVLNDFVDESRRSIRDTTRLRSDLISKINSGEISSRLTSYLGGASYTNDQLIALVNKMEFVKVELAASNRDYVSIRVDDSSTTYKQETVPNPLTQVKRTALYIRHIDSIIDNDASYMFGNFGFLPKKSENGVLGYQKEQFAKQFIEEYLNRYFTPAEKAAIYSSWPKAGLRGYQKVSDLKVFLQPYLLTKISTTDVANIFDKWNEKGGYQGSTYAKQFLRPYLLKYFSENDAEKIFHEWSTSGKLEFTDSSGVIHHDLEALKAMMRESDSKYVQDLKMAEANALARHEVLTDMTKKWLSDPLLFNASIKSQLFFSMFGFSPNPVPIFNIFNPITSFVQNPYAAVFLAWHGAQLKFSALKTVPFIGTDSVWKKRWKELAPHGPNFFAPLQLLERPPQGVIMHFQKSLLNYTKSATHLWVQTSEGEVIFNPFFGYNLFSQRIFSWIEKGYKTKVDSGSLLPTRTLFGSYVRKHLTELLESRRLDHNKGQGKSIIWEMAKIYVASSIDYAIHQAEKLGIGITDDSTFAGKASRFFRNIPASWEAFNAGMAKRAFAGEASAGKGLRDAAFNSDLAGFERFGTVVGNIFHAIRGLETFSFEAVKAGLRGGGMGVLIDIAHGHNPIDFTNNKLINLNPSQGLALGPIVLSPFASWWTTGIFAWELAKGFPSKFYFKSERDGVFIADRYVREAFNPGSGRFGQFMKNWGLAVTDGPSFLTQNEVSRMFNALADRHFSFAIDPATNEYIIKDDQLRQNFDPRDINSIMKLSKAELLKMFEYFRMEFPSYAERMRIFGERTGQLFKTSNMEKIPITSVSNIQIHTIADFFTKIREHILATIGTGAGGGVFGRFFKPAGDAVFKGVGSYYIYKVAAGFGLNPIASAAIAGGYFAYDTWGKYWISNSYQHLTDSWIGKVRSMFDVHQQETLKGIFKGIDTFSKKGIDIFWYSEVSKEAGPLNALWTKGVAEVGGGVGEIWHGVTTGNFNEVITGLFRALNGGFNVSGVVLGATGVYGATAFAANAVANLLLDRGIALGIANLLKFAFLGTNVVGLVVAATYLTVDILSGGGLSRWILARASDIGHFAWGLISPIFGNLFVNSPSIFTGMSIGAGIGAMIGGFSGGIIGAGLGALIGGILGGFAGWLFPGLFNSFNVLGGLAALLSLAISFLFLFRRNEVSAVIIGVVMMGFSLFPILALAGLKLSLPYFDYSGGTTGNGYGQPFGNGSCPLHKNNDTTGDVSGISCTGGNEEAYAFPGSTGHFRDLNHYYSMAEDIAPGSSVATDYSVIAPVDGTIVTSDKSDPCFLGKLVLQSSDNPDVAYNMIHVIPDFPAGTKVKSGDRIGRLATTLDAISQTGNSTTECWTGPHLHIELDYFNTASNTIVTNSVAHDGKSWPCPVYNAVSAFQSCTSDSCKIGTSYGCPNLPVNGDSVTKPHTSSVGGVCPITKDSPLAVAIKSAAEETQVPPELLAAELEYNSYESGGAQLFNSLNYSDSVINGLMNHREASNDDLQSDLTYSNSYPYRFGPLGIFSDNLSKVSPYIAGCKTGSGGFDNGNLNDHLITTGLIFNSYANNGAPQQCKKDSPQVSWTSDDVKNYARKFVCTNSSSAGSYPSCGINESTSISALYTYFKANCSTELNESGG